MFFFVVVGRKNEMVSTSHLMHNQYFGNRTIISFNSDTGFCEKTY